MSERSKPKAVLISDVHYNINTLPLADAAMRAAIAHANKLGVLLIVAGDLHDTKALMRGECVKAMIETFKQAEDRPLILVGNHCLLNEKGKEHSLEFLKPWCDIVASPVDLNGTTYLIPYYSDADELRAVLSIIPIDRTLIMHQGLIGSNAGHYMQDKSALNKEDVASFRIISGHYHRRQDIKTPKGGLFSYIGNPYTLSFGEANDPPKGYQILNSDGSLTPVPLNLRKHVVLAYEVSRLPECIDNVNTGDIIWLKVTGPQSELAALKKQEVGMRLFGHTNFKFDKIPTDSAKIQVNVEKQTGEEIFDRLIDATDEKPEEKKALKELWKELV